jgi:hypothetical protein
LADYDPPFEMSAWGQRLRERTQPLAPDDDLYDWAHATLCEALAQPFLQVAELVDPPDPMPPWGPLFDVDSCPGWALPWLAQAVGAVLPGVMPEEEVRRTIKEVAGQAAGTKDSMYNAMLGTLTGDHPTVYFRERDGHPYRLEVVTRTSETPDPAATLAALLAFKPGAIKLTFRQVAGWDYQAMVTAGGTYATLKTTYTTYQRLAEKIEG